MSDATNAPIETQVLSNHSAINPGASVPAEQAPAPVTPAASTAPAAAAAPLQIGEPAPATPADPATLEAESEAVEYAPTGDVGLDLALDFIGRQGFGPENAGVKAAINGDFSILKAQLAGAGEKARGWEQYIALAEKAFETSSKASQERQAKDQAAIYGAVGGEQSWAEIAKWAGTNADPAEKAEINAALSAGGRQAVAMATYLASLYERAAGTTREPGSAVNPNAGRSSAASGALSPREYADAVAALYRKVGGRIDDSPEYARLQARRAAYRG